MQVEFSWNVQGTSAINEAGMQDIYISDDIGNGVLLGYSRNRQTALEKAQRTLQEMLRKVTDEMGTKATRVCHYCGTEAR